MIIRNQTSSSRTGNNFRPRPIVVGWIVFGVLLVVVLISSRTNNVAVNPTDRDSKSSEISSDVGAFVIQAESIAELQHDQRDLTPRADAIPIVEAKDKNIATVNYSVAEPVARVLIVRGVFTVFSLGLDKLGRKLQKMGYEVRVTPAIRSSLEAQKLRNKIVRENDQLPLVIIGHSLGGDLAPGLASIFGSKNVSVDLLVMLDSTMPSAPPQNVRRCINLYQSNASPEWARVFRGANIDTHSPETELYNVDIRKLAGRQATAGIHHFNIDTNPWVQELIINAVQSGLQDGSFSELTLGQNSNAVEDNHAELQRDQSGSTFNLADEPNAGLRRSKRNKSISQRR